MPGYRRVIHWFRRDLRLTDNSALSAAVGEAEEVIPVYVISDWKGGHRWTGAGRQAFLSGCLESLSSNIDHVGGKLIFRTGVAERILPELIRETGAEAIFFNRDPDPHGKLVEERLKVFCEEENIAFNSFQDAVLHEGPEVLTGGGSPYRVFTPYFNSWQRHNKPRPNGAVKRLCTPEGIASEDCPTVETWGLTLEHSLPRVPGERAARERMKEVIESRLSLYRSQRDSPSDDATSHLGADLRYGTLSVRELYWRVEEARNECSAREDRESFGEFQRQLGWREFYMGILHHYPEVLESEFNPAWRGLEWDDPNHEGRFQKWCEGRTGFPIVDAGMRQLVETGYMHNRVRMITAMFLTKDLHLDWRLGESFFLQHLLDGEIANNNGGWQWSAGTGADAAPYFRIQNPWTQTARYDPDGAYIGRWVPELSGLEGKRLAKAPPPGQSIAPEYPAPMVDHGAEREETLRRFKAHREAVGV